MSLILNMILHDNLEDLKKKKAEIEVELKKLNEAIEKLEK